MPERAARPGTPPARKGFRCGALPTPTVAAARNTHLIPITLDSRAGSQPPPPLLAGKVPESARAEGALAAECWNHALAQKLTGTRVSVSRATRRSRLPTGTTTQPRRWNLRGDSRSALQRRPGRSPSAARYGILRLNTIASSSRSKDGRYTSFTSPTPHEGRWSREARAHRRRRTTANPNAASTAIDPAPGTMLTLSASNRTTVPVPPRDCGTL